MASDTASLTTQPDRNQTMTAMSIITPAQLAMAQTGRLVALEGGRTLEMLIKYGVEYAIINTPFGVEYYGPLEQLLE